MYPVMFKRLFVGLCLLACVPQGLRADDLFRERIAPLLERRCVTCHNDQQNAGDFSLQSAQAAFADGYIDANDIDASYLVDLITPVNGKAAMPKDASPLTDEELQLIKDWIASGAQWPDGLTLHEPQVSDFDWWSFQPVKKPEIPAIDDAWIKTPIDAFILQAQQTQGLKHSQKADRRTLIRRVTFDLIGLPPTPEEVETFVSSQDPEAYEKLVDRLLASEHYGERWARHWMDVVKYADTCGYDKDKLRPNAWPYRDYVIRSFNEDKPYERFVQEQVAGDAIFPGEPDGILGLGFIAAGPWDFIGHVEVSAAKIDGKVARNLDRDDMVSNTLNTFCSVTIQCARCHHHKFDPFTQQHYYGLQSVFAAVDRAERPYNIPPEVESERYRLDALVKSSKAQLDALQKEVDAAGGERLKELKAIVSTLEGQSKVTKQAEFGYHSAIASDADTKKWIEITLPEAAEVTRIVLHPCHDEYAGIGSGFGFPARFKVEVSASDNVSNQPEWQTIADYTDSDFSNPRLNPVELNCEVDAIRRVRVTATKLSERKDDYIFALAEVEVLGADGNVTNLAAGAEVAALDSIEMPPRWGKRNLVDGKWAIGGDSSQASQLSDAISERDLILKKIETPEWIARRETVRKTLEESQKSIKELPAGSMVYAAATRFAPQGNFNPTQGEPRKIQVLLRGDVQTPGGEIGPGVLPFQADAEWELDPNLSEVERRAKLATWLTQPDHPLVWRSIVNRIWQYHFGEGIVATPNDFGHMGTLPTHPELLDWLACEFRDGGQSFKSLHRLIVNSSVYQQASDHDEVNAELDGGNQYLWRMNRRRLAAEEIRDSILVVSGTLNTTMGGPGFYLFEIEHPEHSPHFEYRKFNPADPASHRRSIYRFIVRSQPNPWMTTLDCADSSQSTPKRIETLTSLQALSLLNNQFNLEMAQQFANRLREHSDALENQIELAMQLIAQRAATDEEQKLLGEYAKQHGLENMCRFIFNLSEFVYLD